MPNISLLSWNIAFAKPSISAPKHWKEEYADETRKEIQRLIQQYSPDILAIQEIPNPNWLPMLVSFDQYIPLGTAPTHSGYCALLVRTKHVHKIDQVYRVGPSVLAFWKGQHEALYAISSMHLYPGSNGGINRKEQFKAILATCVEKKYAGGIFAGDMNMRKQEEQEIEGLHKPPLIDVWKLMGTPKNRWTWNSKINHYHPRGHTFQARFDRIYYTGKGISPHSFTRVGDQSLTNPHHFASDHFGIVTTMKLH